MTDILALLFEKRFGSGPLFKNQVDLVSQLLKHPQSELFKPDDDPDAFTKRQTNLKAYVSQLLSHTVNRTITEEFRKSLSFLISEKITLVGSDPKPIIKEVFDELQKRNSNLSKQELNDHNRQQIETDIDSAKYISVITSRPLEITREYQNKSSSFSFQPFLLEDIVATFSAKSSRLKSYRFNFPMQRFGEIFWNGLRRFVRFYVERHSQTEQFHNVLIKRFGLSQDLVSRLTGDADGDEVKNEVVDNLLLKLNDEKYIVIFIVDAPIFTIPIIAIDPDQNSKARIYALFDDGEGNISPYRYSTDDYVLWRLFVWDSLKTSKNSKQLTYRYILDKNA
ncbi:hypothetical protein [Flaviaesturariibacter amylovorans]|uniref:Uncharacterized protein n=1 Tax=Flaviaesturariibacter amylovorans TaxID=1084520 RepID=A0ABP8H587_9BACT